MRRRDRWLSFEFYSGKARTRKRRGCNCGAGATGEHKEKPGFGGKGWNIKKSQVRTRKAPGSHKGKTARIRKSREHKGRNPQLKKKLCPFVRSKQEKEREGEKQRALVACEGVVSSRL